MSLPDSSVPDLPLPFVPKVAAVGDQPVSIIKLGGSLLTVPDLLARLHHTMQSLQISNTLLVVGGGAAAEQIRLQQYLLQFDDHTAHWLAIEAMSSNARQLERLDRRLLMVNDRTAARAAWNAGRIPLLHTARFLRDEEDQLRLNPADIEGRNSRSAPLPRSWAVTSDSIAAWIAARWTAADLWLLKSCDSAFSDPGEMSANGLVDTFFPEALAPDCRLHWLNLRRNAMESRKQSLRLTAAMHQ